MQLFSMRLYHTFVSRLHRFHLQELNIDDVWYLGGSQEDPNTIYLNYIEWKVTQNLFGALSQLRPLQGDDRIVWIDALAINQSDILERNAQVTKMPTVYFKASTTLVWLGSDSKGNLSQLDGTDVNNIEDILHSADNPFLLFFALSRLQQSQRLDSKFFASLGYKLVRSSNMWSGLLQAIMKFTEISYWTRVWVIQELWYSHNVVLMYGQLSAPYKGFSDVLVALLNMIEGLYQLVGNKNDLNRGASSIFGIIAWERVNVLNKLIPHGLAQRGEYMSLADWRNLVRHGGKESTDPRDVVYGLRGCFPPEIQEKLPVDYGKQIVDLQTFMTRLCIEEERSIDCILGCCADVYRASEAPSWFWIFGRVEKYTYGEACSHRITPNAEDGKFRASGDLPFTVEFHERNNILHLKGKTCFIVNAIVPH
jgi:hypothetical protein